ncbi:MAG: helix-turn-helix domain-containing protein, partial [bacterium]
IEGHLLAAVNAGEELNLDLIVQPEFHDELSAAFLKLGFGNLTGVHELLGEKFSYGQLRLFRALKQSHDAISSGMQMISR